MSKLRPINYAAYESEKRNLQHQNLTPEQYEAELKRLADKYHV